MTGVAVSFLLPIIAGYFICHRLLPYVRNAALLIPLTLGVGFGITSITFFLSCLFGGGIVLSEILLLAVLLFALFLKKNGSTTMESAQEPEKNNISLLIALSILVLSAAVYLCILSYNNPHGGWDAWTVWNAHARLIHRDPSNAMQNLSRLQDWSHPYYPLLLPAIVARAWIYAASEIQAAPSIMGGIFAFSTVTLLYGVLRILRNKRPGIIAGCVLIGTPFFLQTAANQYADVPLCFFLTSSVAMIFLAIKNEFHGNEMVMAGIFAGLAAWTKTEGLIFTVALGLAIPFLVRTTFVRKGIGPYIAGAIPFVLVTMFLKDQIPLEPYYIRESGTALSRLMEVARWKETAVFSLLEMTRFGSWILSMPLLLIGYGVIVGRHTDAELRRGAMWMGLVLLLVFFVYFLSFIMTPLNLKWQLNTALPRLIIHLWAPGLLIFFLSIRT